MALTQVTSAGVKDGELVNADLSGSAAIALSKLATGALPSGLTVASANITDGTIVNADIASNAAIALSKLGTSGTAGSGNFLRGDGAWTAIDLTALSASNLTSGTVPDARFPATLPAASGVNLTALNASNLTSGTVATARLGSGGGSSSNFLRGDGTWASAGVGSDGAYNTSGGGYAGNSLDGDSTKNTFFGYYAGNVCNDGDSNVCVGYQAGDHITSGSESIAIGDNALTAISTVGKHVAIGHEALKRLTSAGAGNVAIGWHAMTMNQTGGYSVAIGYQALGSSTGQNNVGIGYDCGLANTGNNNTYLGASCAKDHVGTNCIVIGAQANPSGNSATNEITLGHTDVTKFRIPGINFELADNGGTPTNGHVLTMASGGATWQAASSGLSNIVEDTSPQLGGDLDANGYDIILDDDKALEFGNLSQGDLRIYHDNGGYSVILNQTGDLYIRGADSNKIRIQAKALQNSVVSTGDGSVELFYDGSKKLETFSNGIKLYDTQGDLIGEGFDGGFNFTSLVYVNELRLMDSEKIQLGDNQELKIWHDSNTHSYITEAGGGGMAIGGSMISLMNPATNEYMFKGTENGSVELYYDGAKKFETNSDGVSITGLLAPAANNSHDLGSPSLSWKNIYLANDIMLKDNSVIKMGDGEDFFMYHDGSQSHIRNTTGQFILRSDILKLKNNANDEMYMECTDNGSVDLYYDNTKRFETTTSGATITAGNNAFGLQVDCNDTSYASNVVNVECDRNTTNETYSFFGAHRSGVASVFFVRDSGNVENANNSYGSTSDERLKENIVDAGSQWDDIKNLKVRKFNFKETTDPDKKTMIGLVAQEAEKVSPGLVSESKSMQGGVEDTYKTVKYSILYMKAIKALQEAITKIETLETKVAALEGG